MQIIVQGARLINLKSATKIVLGGIECILFNKNKTNESKTKEKKI